MKRLIAIAIIFVVIFKGIMPMDQVVDGESVYTSASSDSVYTYLVLGFDDKGENTDSILIMSYNSALNSFSLMQIPRDTYFKVGNGRTKINLLYGYYRSLGLSKEDALRYTCDVVSEALGIAIRGYASFTPDAFSRFIDALGGVRLNLSDDTAERFNSIGMGLHFVTGENFLNGTDALHFVRFREGYALADITRLDAQKIFLRAMISAVKQSMSPGVIYKIIRSAGDGFLSNIKITELLKLTIKYRKKINDISYSFFTSPGKTVRDDSSIWYYSLNMPEITKLFCKYGFEIRSEFDPNGVLLNSESKDFVDIYYSEDINVRIFTNEELKDMNLY